MHKYLSNNELQNAQDTLLSADFQASLSLFFFPFTQKITPFSILINRVIAPMHRVIASMHRVIAPMHRVIVAMHRVIVAMHRVIMLMTRSNLRGERVGGGLNGQELNVLMSYL
jgi:hypothetical protein